MLSKIVAKPNPFPGQNRLIFTLMDLPDYSEFTQEMATFFVENWMSSVSTQMLKVMSNWAEASPDDKADYIGYLRSALIYGDHVIDAPEKGYTNPLGAFAETMLRYLRKQFENELIIFEPQTPRPPGQGDVDLIEISGSLGKYDTLRVTLWEVKGSDKQASSHNSKIYSQLTDYPNRLYTIANELAERYSGSDPQFKRFLRDMGTLARKKSPQIHYGAFVAYDSKIAQKVEIVPGLHKRPPGHPSIQGVICHHAFIFLVPDFEKRRCEVWRYLNLSVKTSDDISSGATNGSATSS